MQPLFRCTRRRSLALTFVGGLALSLTLPACNTGDNAPKTGLVMQAEEIEGEGNMLLLEDNRQKGSLSRRFSSRDPNVRARAALTAARLLDQANLEGVQGLLTDREPAVRANAVFAVALLAGETEAEAIEAMVLDPEPAVRSAALLGLRLIGAPVVAAAHNALAAASGDPLTATTAGDACLLVAEAGDASYAPTVAAWLQDPDPEVRWKATYALYRLAAEPEALLHVLGDPDERVRAYAALAIAASGYWDGVPYLLPLLEHNETTVVCAAANALGTLADARAEEALATLAGDSLPRRRFAGIQALSRSGLAPAKLRELSKDASPYIRALAITGLHKAGASNKPLLDAAQDEAWQVRAAAARALAARNEIDILATQMVYDPDGKVVPAVLEGLADIGYTDLDTLLIKHSEDKDPAVRATAARLVVGRNVSQAVEILTRSYEHSRSDELLVSKLGIIQSLALEAPTSEAGLNTIKQGALAPNWVLKNRAYETLSVLDRTGKIERPSRVGTLRTESFYRSLIGRGDFDYRTTLVFDKGTVEFRLFPKTSQLTLSFFEEVVNSGFYLDLPLSGLDPAMELAGGDDRGDGHGQYIGWGRDEPQLRPFDRPMLSLRRPYGRDSTSSQLRISFLPRPDLDGRDTPLGELYAGKEVLDQLVPGDVLRRVTVSQHEFQGTLVQKRVRTEVDKPKITTTTVAAGEPPHAEWQRPPAHVPMAVVAGVFLLAGLAPLVTGSRDIPLSLWVVVLLMIVVVGGYGALILTGQYHSILTSESPGPRDETGAPNPPIMDNEAAYKIATGALAFIILEYALLYLLASGKPLARWLFVLIALLEIMLFAAQLRLGIMVIYVLSNIGIASALAKGWMLVADRAMKEYFDPSDHGF